MRVIQVIKRQLSKFEIEEQRKKLVLNKPTNTKTISKKLAGGWYIIEQIKL